MAEPSIEKLKKAGEIREAREALLPENIDSLFDEGYLPMEDGCCRLENGCVVIAALTEMPGVSPEMFDWWYVWHGREPMRFKIWNRNEHYSCRRRDDLSSPSARRGREVHCWDMVYEIEEDAGYGREKTFVHYRRPEDIGFNPQKLASFGGTIICSGDESSPMLVCHFLRPVEGGCELRSRIWLGYGAANGKAKKLLPNGAKVPLEPAKALLEHNIRDFTHLASVLPELYERFADKP